MNNLKIIGSLVLLVVLTACQEGELLPDELGLEKEMVLQSALDERNGFPEMATRNIKTAFIAGDQLGLFVMDHTLSGTYRSNTGYRNLYSTYDGKNWIHSCGIALNDDPATVLAYYPYQSSVTDYQIPVKTFPQIDYLYSGIVNEINRYNPKVNVSMKHAMSCFRLKIKRGNYRGTGNLSSVGIQSGSLGSSALLNIASGELSSLSGLGSRITQDGLSSPIRSDETTDIEVFVIPATTSGDIHFYMTLDGIEYSCTVPGITPGIQQGKMYTYTLIANANSVTVSDVSIEYWQTYSLSEDNTIEASYTITIGGKTEGIAFSYAINNQTITITAVAIDTRSRIKSVSLQPSSGATFNQSADNVVKTITLSNIIQDIELVFDGVS